MFLIFVMAGISSMYTSVHNAIISGSVPEYYFALAKLSTDSIRASAGTGDITYLFIY
jgi:hypothetical protein